MKEPITIQFADNYWATYTEKNGRYYIQFSHISKKTGLKVYGSKIRISKHEYDCQCGGREG